MLRPPAVDDPDLDPTVDGPDLDPTALDPSDVTWSESVEEEADDVESWLPGICPWEEDSMVVFMADLSSSFWGVVVLYFL